jgi:nitronate monooxygenase
MITSYKGMKLLEKAAFTASYKTVWCAGSSIEFTHKIESIKGIVDRYKQEFNEAKNNLNKITDQL